MKHLPAILLGAFLLAIAVVGAVQFKKRRDLEQRTALAVRILRNAYVLTPEQTLRVVCVNGWKGNVCTEYLVDDSREQSFIKFAVFEKDSKSLNYDLDQNDIEDRCSTAGVDLTNVAEKELQNLTIRSVD